MEGICKIKEIDKEEWVVFDEKFNKQLTPDIIQFLSKYQNVLFGIHFNKSVDNLPNSLTHLRFGFVFNQRVDNLPNSLTQSYI